MSKGGSYPSLNLTDQALLTPHGSSYSLQGVSGGWAGGALEGAQEEGWEG